MPHRKRQRTRFTWVMQTRCGIIRQAAMVALKAEQLMRLHHEPVHQAA
jgi:hypothetical protein